MKLNCIMIAAAMACLAPAAALAGEASSAEVNVQPLLRTAHGDLVTARYEANAAVKIQCGVQVFANGTKEGSCTAVDAAGDAITTNTTSNADMPCMGSATTPTLAFRGTRRTT